VNTNNEHKKIIHKFIDLQINYSRRTALNISSSAYSNVFSNEYATMTSDCYAQWSMEYLTGKE
jgi:hypothetical protein